MNTGNKVMKKVRLVTGILLILLLVYLFIPIKMGIRDKVNASEVDEIVMRWSFYNPDKNAMDRTEIVISDDEDISKLIKEYNNTFALLSLKSLKDRSSFSHNGTTDDIELLLYMNNYQCIKKYILTNKHLKQWSGNYLTYRKFRGLDTYLEFFD